jgi:hypothetical protein
MKDESNKASEGCENSLRGFRQVSYRPLSPYPIPKVEVIREVGLKSYSLIRAY